MINISQTLKYIELCSKAGIESIPRTRLELESALSSIEDMSVVLELNELISDPQTADAYLELMRIQVSMRAMGLLQKQHPVAMLNITNVQNMLLSCQSPEEVIDKIARYNIGDVSSFGAFIDLADRYWDIVEGAGKIDDVFANCHLNRLLSLCEVAHASIPSSECIDEINTPIVNDYMRQ